MGNKFFEANLIYAIVLSSVIAFASAQSSNSIISCLNDNQVTNFTLLPTSPNQNSTAYDSLLSFSLQNLRFAGPNFPKPSLIILPQNKQQLVSSLLCSKKGGFEVRIRCGGHSSEGLSSVDYEGKPFVIIDLMSLHQVVVDVKTETAWVEGGTLLGGVYSAIAEQSKGAYGFAAGICPTVGSGGHISGGGYGFLTRKYGLAADNVVDAQLVVADGRVLNRASMGEDVFWAIRGGGGGSFGIVYAWKIKILKVPPTVTALVARRRGSIDDMSQLVNRWQYVGPNLEDNFYLSASFRADPTGSGNVSAMFTALYLGPKVEAKSSIDQQFPELGVQDAECNEMPWIQSVARFAGMTSLAGLQNRFLQNKTYFKSKSDYVQTAIPIEGLKGALGFLVQEPKGMITLDPNGGIMARIPSDSIAYPHRAGNLFDIQYFVTWGKDDDNNRGQYLTWVRAFYDFMTPFVSSNPRAAYVNNLDLDLGGLDEFKSGGGYEAVEKGRVWGEKYFGNNYDRLVQAKTVIDPCNVFKHAQGIPPKFSPASNKKCLNP